MFRDRASQFKTRLKWQVDVDENGFERDEYDALNPLYLILENNLGRHERLFAAAAHDGALYD